MKNSMNNMSEKFAEEKWEYGFENSNGRIPCPIIFGRETVFDLNYKMENAFLSKVTEFGGNPSNENLKEMVETATEMSEVFAIKPVSKETLRCSNKRLISLIGEVPLTDEEKEMYQEVLDFESEEEKYQTGYYFTRYWELIYKIWDKIKDLSSTYYDLAMMAHLCEWKVRDGWSNVVQNYIAENPLLLSENNEMKEDPRKYADTCVQIHGETYWPFMFNRSNIMGVNFKIYKAFLRKAIEDTNDISDDDLKELVEIALNLSDLFEVNEVNKENKKRCAYLLKNLVKDVTLSDDEKRKMDAILNDGDSDADSCFVRCWDFINQTWDWIKELPCTYYYIAILSYMNEWEVPDTAINIVEHYIEGNPILGCNLYSTKMDEMF